MLDNCTIYPDVMPEIMNKFKEDFKKRSSKLSNTFSPSLDATFKKSSIIEWEDGWAQFNLTEDQLIVHSIYSNKDTALKFNYLYHLAKSLNKKEVVFETERDPKSWIRLIDSTLKNFKHNTKTRLISYVMAVEID